MEKFILHITQRQKKPKRIYDSHLWMVEDKEELCFIILIYFLIGTKDPYKNKSSKYSHSNKWRDQFNFQDSGEDALGESLSGWAWPQRGGLEAPPEQGPPWCWPVHTGVRLKFSPYKYWLMKERIWPWGHLSIQSKKTYCS